jgi:Spy/CpxP family protein refolding chaperone
VRGFDKIGLSAVERDRTPVRLGKWKRGGNMGKRKGMLASSLLVFSFLSLGNIALGGGQGMWENRLREPRDRAGVERLLALLDSDRIRTYLRLEDSQVERLRQIALEAEKANVKIRAEIEVRSIELREALRADKPDRDEILKKVQGISDLRGGMMKHNVEAILAAKAVLSPEQQRKLFLLIETRYEGRPAGEERRGMRAKPLPSPGVPPQPAPLHPGEPPVQ